MPSLTEAEINQADRDSQGWCTTCNELTRDCTEPDAEDYDCPKCGENTVVCAMQAVLLGALEVT
jgi:Zn finger protein HypA/HybF involved in hydrogenase expression